MQTKKIIILSAIILVAALTRLLPHPMNFTPLGAMALFGGAYFGRNGLGLLLTMSAWLISDFLLNNFIYESGSSIVWFTEGASFIYGSIILIYFLGSRLLNKPSWASVLAGGFAASAIFFLITNFGVWIGGSMYPLTIDGLVTCYVAAIPFFQNTLAGDLVYAAVLFLTFEKILKSQLLLDRVK